MNIWKQIKRVIKDPPPAYVFEISHAGIAFSRESKKHRVLGFQPLEPDVLSISPLKDNVVRPEVFFDQVKQLAPVNGGSRTAALILPDYSARVAILDFDNFPSDKEEQLALVRFRMKKSIPFELESARVSYEVQPSGSKKLEVAALVAALEIVARYETAFRNAGFRVGLVTTSTLAARDLILGPGVRVTAKLDGRMLTVAVTEEKNLRLLRCIELPEVTPAEVIAVLYPTFAYTEDQFAQRPSSLLMCGFGELAASVSESVSAELGVPAEPLRSRLGKPDETNTGLLGLLEQVGD